jgi:hypothetical protein
MTSPAASDAHERTIRELSDRLVDAQRPIRILDAIKWDAGVEAAFFADGCRTEPRVARSQPSRAFPNVPTTSTFS